VDDGNNPAHPIVGTRRTDCRKRRDLSKLVQVVLAQAEDLEAVGRPSRA
jgi:hypothetical protein